MDIIHHGMAHNLLILHGVLGLCILGHFLLVLIHLAHLNGIVPLLLIVLRVFLVLVLKPTMFKVCHLLFIHRHIAQLIFMLLFTL